MFLRTNGAPIEPNMVTIWLDEEEASGIVIRETGWLRRTAHIIASDPGYIVSERGWATLDEHLANERRACREPSPADPPVLTAKETGPHALITMGD
ncbi:hypothetical protein [Sphingomonas sp. RB1R13]|uniref:hypothetical protein n=1 Tax=Sphingomonas sp. RB1R13 TaxID=3096159 RepID=UPI002FC9178A